MVHGYHLILSMYGYWLPNDPRGAWSEFVRKWELARFSVQSDRFEKRSLDQLSPDELQRREEARHSLEFPPVSIDGLQAESIARGFGKHCLKNDYTVWACAILPEHVHLVIARHRFKVEQMANLLKGAATRQLVADGLHPLKDYRMKNGKLPSPWSMRAWKCYLDSEEAIENAMAYVIENPIKEGKEKQSWEFVTPFAGLPKNAWTTYH